MEQHGNNPEQKVVAVIPARYGSTRLAGKLLLEIGGIPLIVHTLNQVKKASGISRVIVAADDQRIVRVVEAHGGEVLMTSESHQSGSDRIAEVAGRFLPEGAIIVNVQGDEPLIPPSTIERAVAAILEDESVDVATTCEPIDSIADVLDPNIVKVVRDLRSDALYFSRSPIPFPRTAVERFGTLEKALTADPSLLGAFRKHTGLYVYRREFLLRFTAMQRSTHEITEMLEQLRALEHGATIRVVDVAQGSVGVDTAADFERAKRLIEGARR